MKNSQHFHTKKRHFSPFLQRLTIENCGFPFRNAVYENIVGDMLVKQGYQLYFYKNDRGTLEMDFFVRDANSLIPVTIYFITKIAPANLCQCNFCLYTSFGKQRSTITSPAVPTVPPYSSA